MTVFRSLLKITTVMLSFWSSPAYTTETTDYEETNLSEHSYFLGQLVLDTDFEGNDVSVGSALNEFADLVSVNSDQFDLIGSRKVGGTDELGIDFKFTDSQNSGNNLDHYKAKFKDEVKNNIELENIDVKAITLQNEVVYENTRWEKLKQYGSEKWEKFQDTELTAVEVTLWTLGLGLPSAIGLGVCMYKWKRRRDSMFDQGVVSIKLKTMKNEV